MLNRDIPIQACNAESLGKNLLQFNISIARRSVTANFCLQTFPAPISVFAINYLKYWNCCKYRGATAYLRARRLPGHFPLHLLFICSIVLQMSTCNPLWKLLIARFGFVELCAAGRHEIKISKVLRLIRTREGKKVDLQDFSFVAKPGGVCASRRGARPPVTFYLFAAATKFNLQPIQPQGLTSKTIIV